LASLINTSTGFYCVKILILQHRCCPISWACSIPWFLRRQIIIIPFHFGKILMPTGTTPLNTFRLCLYKEHTLLPLNISALPWVWSLHTLHLCYQLILLHLHFFSYPKEKWHRVQCQPLARGVWRTTRPSRRL